MPDDGNQDAEEKVAATTAGYGGGPVSDEELAEVWLPEGQQKASETVEAADDSPDGAEPPD